MVLTRLDLRSLSHLKRGNELREQRGKLIAEQEATSNRLKDVDSEISQLSAKVIELRGQETEQRKLAEKVDRGRTLPSMNSSAARLGLNFIDNRFGCGFRLPAPLLE